jgi:DNA repair photolyase
MQQALLPITCEPFAALPEPRLRLARHEPGVEYRELATREILNRARSRRSPFDWSLNPYRGCEHGCSYCPARFTHGFFGLDRWQDFERKIFVKRGAARSLERRLRRTDLAGQSIAIGTAADPYQPAEGRYRVTRSLLSALSLVEGLEISIATRSPLILRDLDLLTRLDRGHSISIEIGMTTLDPRLARRLERSAPEPRERLQAIERLAAEGIATRVQCVPLMPGINDREKILRPLLEAARDVGAFDVVAEPLALRPATRARFWPWLREEFPGLEERYRRLFAGREYLDRAARERVMAVFRALRLQHGFPAAVAGRT